MGQEATRRCALWVSSQILADAQELADLLGVDVDTFVAMAILSLYDQEAEEGRLHARVVAIQNESNNRVVPIRAGRRGRRGSEASHEDTAVHSIS